ncbi:MAG: translation initiation factor IF-2 [Bacilli bacterium]|nr:translation initiation factor IF-2 [Bacilli bacterium]
MRVEEVALKLDICIDELIDVLENIDFEDANKDTELDDTVLKKLSKKYKVELKGTKKKKEDVSVSSIISKANEAEKNKEAEAQKRREIEEQERLKALEEAEKKKKEEQERKKKEAEKKKLLEAEKKKEEENKKKEAEAQKKKEQEEKEAEIELRHNYDEDYESYENEANKEKVYTRLKNVKKKSNKNTKDRRANIPQEKQEGEKVLYFSEGMTVAKIADGLGKSVGEIVKKLVMLGFFASASDTVERDVVEIVADDCGYVVKNEINTDITKFEEIEIVDNEEDLVERPAIVTIMGHVDHGKTTLLDTIRSSKVTAGEAGGITQHIGAYQVKKNGKLITFIDTPGHAAFTEMRARGANITDIVILVVAADDGVMPQTVEAIEHARAAKVPIIVAVNKMDKPQANPDRIKQELANYDLLCEEWGGKTIFVPISALKGTGVEDLLEMILLVAEMNGYKANPNRLATGSVIEAKLDKGKGTVATLLVKNGTLKVGDPIVVGNTWGKVRAMQDETKVNLKQALPSKAVEITGLDDVPMAGDSFMVFSDEKTARLVCNERKLRKNQSENEKGRVSLSTLFNNLNDETKELNLIIKGDVQGSIEALNSSLEKINVEGVKINIVRSSVGAITETDISLAEVSNAIVIAFNIRPQAKITDLAKEKGIEIRFYNIIYKLLEDIEAAMQGLLDPVYEEKVIGEVVVRETYKVSKVGTIAGCYVTNGCVERNAHIRVNRDSVTIYDGKIASLKRFKDDVKEVKAGFECGIMIEGYNDVKVDDIFEIYIMEQVK